MSVARLLTDLRARGIELTVRDGRLISRAPKGALTPELADRLRMEKQEIIAFLQEAGRDAEAAGRIPPLQPAPRTGELMPVSFSQERLWYLSQVEANPAVYNMPLSFRLRGPLDAGVLQRTLDALEARHESLRTTIVEVGGQARQRIRPPVGLPLRVEDMRADGDEAVWRAMQDEAMTPFDLAQGPLARASLFRAADEEHYFLLVSHHVIADGLSTQILLRELVSLYEAFAAGRPSPLPDLPVQFADYAVWQRAWLQGGALDEQAQYWKEQLGEELPTLDMPVDRPRPPVRSAEGSKEPFRFDRELMRRLAAIGRDEGATVYMVLLALYAALLHRHTGQDDVVIGTPVANRTRRETADIVGFVANTLALRVSMAGRPSFRALVRRVREVALGAYRHQDMPFQQLVELLNPPRDLSRTPVCQAFFTFHEITSQETRMGPLDLEPIVVGSTVSRMDLSLFLRELDESILGSLEYNTDIFSRDTALRLVARFERLARSAADAPDAVVGDLALLTDDESGAFADWNRSDQPVPATTAHELIWAQAARSPEAVAVRSGEATLRYDELRREARTLAARLQAAGVAPGDLVGLCVGRSARLPVTLLGVLEAGAAYVPLDPEFPPARLAVMVEDAGLRVAVCDPAVAGRLPLGLTLVDPAADGPVAEHRPAAVTPADRAYVIFTSGSTGRPKGVTVRHRNLVNLLCGMRERPGMAADDVFVAVTTLSFDIAALELLLPLVVGGTVEIASQADVMDGARLAALCDRAGATVMQGTPATWRMLLDAGWTGGSLRAWCGGEALPPDLAARLLPRVGALWNMYGPTETTIWSTCTRVVTADAPITLGRPTANTVLRVSDPFGQEAPVGVPGELWIGGAGVTAGYHGRDDLTAARFLPGDNGAPPFYRTGDLVRRLPDGDLVFLGRLDHQVKLQGFRIELGEVEAVLASMAGIAEAVVVAHRAKAGDRLVAYVVPEGDHAPTTSEVRRFLREGLPAYMVPGLILILDALPRTANGKVDRARLPDPLAGAVRVRGHVPPATDAERTVASAWEALLPGIRVGREDNFFELGGHSLLSLRAVAAIEARTGMRLDPRLMFFQTVEQIARRLAPAAEDA